MEQVPYQPRLIVGVRTENVPALTKGTGQTIQIEAGGRRMDFQPYLWVEELPVIYFARDMGIDDSKEVLPDLARNPLTESAYIEGPPTSPPCGPISLPPPHLDQEFLIQVGVNFARDFCGGQGENVRIADIERGWLIDHEQLQHLGLPPPSRKIDELWHGTGVVGILAASIAPPIEGIAALTPQIFPISVWYPNLRQPGMPYHSTAHAIREAIQLFGQRSPFSALRNLILIETQIPDPWGRLIYGLPAEVEPAVFDMIQLANRQGITVVEAAGNGGHPLDTWSDPWCCHPLRRCLRNDSGAILVGACNPSDNGPLRTDDGSTNYGERIDCFASGLNVVTAGNKARETDKAANTNEFSGTSAAAAIVAGVAALTLSIAEAHSYILPPALVRHILRTQGTPSNDPVHDGIGVMPHLKLILNDLGIK
jgi:subtilisin family serine protease